VIVLDTNVLYEIVKMDPDEAVLAWLTDHRRSELWTTAVSAAELAYGVALLPRGRRRESLSRAIAQLLGDGLGGRVLPFDRNAAALYGEIAVTRRRAGRPISTTDPQIAAIARTRGAALVATRDKGGFAGCGLDLVNPWTG